MAHSYHVDLCISKTVHTENSSAPLLTTPCAGSNDHIFRFRRLEFPWATLNVIECWLGIFSLCRPRNPRLFRSLSSPSK
ncbi:hypothetical protein F4805DRAFT_244757 [Annulohypoxylon moriforme]|nr:hypothetical protein F4805DRAFT_244757 [Annulohypoxylon moriforme]